MSCVWQSPVVATHRVRSVDELVTVHLVSICGQVVQLGFPQGRQWRGMFSVFKAEWTRWSFRSLFLRKVTIIVGW